MANNNINSVEQAEKILENGFLEFDDAVRYLEANDKNNAVLNRYKETGLTEAKKQRALEAVARYETDAEFYAAFDYLRKLKKQSLETQNAVASAEVAEQVIAKSNNMNITPENSEAVERNMAWIGGAFKTFENTDGQGVPNWRRYNKDVLDKVNFVDDNSKENAEIREKAEATIWEITKNQILRERSFDFGFMALNKNDRLKLLRADISDSVAEKVLALVGITLTVVRKVDGKVVAEEQAKVNAKESLEALNGFLLDNGGEKAEVTSGAVVGVALHESENMERHISYIRNKGYSSKVVKKFEEAHQNFGQKMKNFWGKMWTGAKEYVANNRTRLITDTAATAGVALAFASGVGYAAVAAYAAYSGIGSLVWPIVEKRRKAIRKAKRENRSYDDYKLGLTFNGLRRAWKDIKSDEKEFRRYKNRAKTGVAASVVIGGGLGVLGTGMVTGVSALAAKVGGTIIRSTGSVTSQFLNYRDTKKDLKLEDNAENRAAHNSAKTGLIIGGAVAAFSAAFGIYNLMESQPEVETNVGNTPKTPQVQHDDEAVQKVAKKTAKAAKKVAEENGVAEVHANIAYPPVWNEESGISQKHFEEIYGRTDADGNWHSGKITGILAKQNKAFEEWNAAHPDDLRHIEVASPEEMYKDMMQNLINARKADPKLFGDLTNDQVIYKYIKLVEYSEKAKEGPLVNGVRTLITVTDKNGLPAYGSNQEEMQAMFKILRCGEKVNVSTEDLNANLDRIDLKTGAGIGKGFDHKTDNVFIGFGEGCDKGVSAWRKVTNTVKKIFKPAEPAPKPETDNDAVIVGTVTEREIKPVDGEVVGATQVKGIEEGDAQVTSVQSKPYIVTGKGTSGHDGSLNDQDGLKTRIVGGVIRGNDGR